MTKAFRSGLVWAFSRELYFAHHQLNLRPKSFNPTHLASRKQQAAHPKAFNVPFFCWPYTNYKDQGRLDMS